MKAKFSKRHYVVIADVLATEYRQAANPSKELGAIYRIAYTLADKFAADNPRFSTEHFLSVVRGEREVNSRPTRRSKEVIENDAFDAGVRAGIESAGQERRQRSEAEDHTDTHEFVMENCVRCGRDIYDAKINPCEPVCPWCKKLITDEDGKPVSEDDAPACPVCTNPVCGDCSDIVGHCPHCSVFERCDNCGEELMDATGEPRTEGGLCDACQKSDKADRESAKRYEQDFNAQLERIRSEKKPRRKSARQGYVSATILAALDNPTPQLYAEANQRVLEAAQKQASRERTKKRARKSRKAGAQ